MYYYGRRDRKTWQPFGARVHQYSRLVIGSFPAPEWRRRSCQSNPRAPYIIILYMQAPTLGPGGGTVGSDGGGGTKTLQLELPVATHPLVKNKIHTLYYASEIRTSTVCM